MRGFTVLLQCLSALGGSLDFATVAVFDDHLLGNLKGSWGGERFG